MREREREVARVLGEKALFDFTINGITKLLYIPITMGQITQAQKTSYTNPYIL